MVHMVGVDVLVLSGGSLRCRTYSMVFGYVEYQRDTLFVGPLG